MEGLESILRYASADRAVRSLTVESEVDFLSKAKLQEVLFVDKLTYVLYA